MIKMSQKKINESMVIFLMKTRGYMKKSWKRLCAQMETVSSPLLIWCSQTYCRRLEVTCKVLLPLIFSSVLHKINLYFALENAWHRINDGSAEERIFFSCGRSVNSSQTSNSTYSKRKISALHFMVLYNSQEAQLRSCFQTSRYIARPHWVWS